MIRISIVYNGLSKEINRFIGKRIAFEKKYKTLMFLVFKNTYVNHIFIFKLKHFELKYSLFVVLIISSTFFIAHFHT